MWKRTRFERFLEIIPGTLSLVVISMPIVLSLVWPAALVVFIILYDFYWLSKSIMMGGHLISAHFYMNYEKHVNWVDKLESLNDLKRLKKDLLFRLTRRLKSFRRNILKDELATLDDLIKNPKKIIKPKDLYQAVLYTTYKEPFDVLYKSIAAVADSDYPNDQIILVLATEDRAGEEAQVIAKKLKKEFAGVFNDFLITTHPDGIVGELKGKGANAHFAGLQMKKYFDNRKIDYERVVVSIFDADTRPSHSYFSALAYKYLLHPDRIWHSYQPIPLYSNNIWQVPAIVRVVAFGSSFWQLMESTRPYRLINFSSQSMSFKTAVLIDFWDQHIVSEDSRTYYRVFFKHHGQHTVIPLFTPVYMDAVYDDNSWQTLKNQYLQKRRWAWGVEHFPYLVTESLKNKTIPFIKKWGLVLRLLESQVSWASAALILALGIWWPFLLSPYFKTTILSFSLPYLAQILLSMTWIGLIISGWASISLLPNRPPKMSRLQTVVVFISWVLTPISGIIFGAIPALDAQMHLLTGRYMGFWVTPKKLTKGENV
ncbi:MAG: glycosyltransferase family 2 protein [Patescibacteria group bacterium]|nr:glycosyltransferase family 2 protein [Patescibacteria group bacterium]